MVMSSAMLGIVRHCPVDKLRKNYTSRLLGQDDPCVRVNL
jgi:hypothetical protein